MTGDGGFLFGVQELATAVQHGINVIAVVFNNNQYGNVQQMQRALYGGRVIASDLHNPDFVALAASFGAAGYLAGRPLRVGVPQVHALTPAAALRSRRRGYSDGERASASRASSRSRTCSPSLAWPTICTGRCGAAGRAGATSYPHAWCKAGTRRDM